MGGEPGARVSTQGRKHAFGRVSTDNCPIAPWTTAHVVYPLAAGLQVKRQMEEDADREIEDLKEKYEQRLSAERWAALTGWDQV